MAPYLIAAVLLAADFGHPEADAAFADAHASGMKNVAYLSLLDTAEANREHTETTLRFLVPSLSASQHLADQLPQRVRGTQLLRLDLDALGWAKSWPEVAGLYARQYRPDLDATKAPPLVLSGQWFAAVISDPNESGDLQYKLLYGEKVPKTLKEFEAFWGVNGDPLQTFGFIEGRSGVKADDADKVRVLEEYPTNTRGYYWVTRDSKNASGKKDPLENLLARPVDHDASEAIASFVKTYNGKGGTAQAYFLANAKGDRQEKAPADIVVDSTGIRGVEIKNTISCVACHLEGLRLPTVNTYREYILSGARVSAKDKADAREIDHFLDSPIAKQIARANEDYAEFVELCNGLGPDENAKRFIGVVRAYDAPLTLADTAREMFTTTEDLELALGYYSRKYGLSARLALLAQGVEISRNQWRENQHLVQKVLHAWREN